MQIDYGHGLPPYPDDVLLNKVYPGYVTGAVGESVSLHITGRMDDQVIVTTDSGDVYTDMSGAGVNVDGTLTVQGSEFHLLAVDHINIAYPSRGNVSFIHCTINGIEPVEVVPDDNEPEVPCDDPCTCNIGDNDAGGIADETKKTSLFDSTSVGSDVVRNISSKRMLWSFQCGMFRGLGNIPASRLELLAYQYEMVLKTPAVLAVRHPLAMYLTIP